MSEAQVQNPTPTPEGNKEQTKRPTGYRVEQQKTIQINRAHTDRRERAQILKTITIGLFGRKRFRNIYLVSSLNNFYYALMIANTLQKRVEKLALVIGLEKVKFTDFAEEGAQGVEKQYSTFSIKITRDPTEADKKHPGYNEGLEKIENPLTEIMKLGGQRRGNERRDVRRRNNYPRREGEVRRREGGDERRRQGGEDRRRQGGDDRRRVERGQDSRRPQRNEGKNYDRDEKDFDRRRPRRQDQGQREGQKEGQAPQRRYYEKRGEEGQTQQGQGQRDRRGQGRDNRNEDNERRQPPQQRYRDEKFEKVENEEYNRGERKTRGTQPQRSQGQGRVVEHEYKKEHMNRRNDDRGDRNPRKNRYSSDED